MKHQTACPLRCFRRQCFPQILTKNHVGNVATPTLFARFETDTLETFELRIIQAGHLACCPEYHKAGDPELSQLVYDSFGSPTLKKWDCGRNADTRRRYGCNLLSQAHHHARSGRGSDNPFKLAVSAKQDYAITVLRTHDVHKMMCLSRIEQYVVT